jgi:glycerate 2-kinase
VSADALDPRRALLLDLLRSALLAVDGRQVVARALRARGLCSQAPEHWVAAIGKAAARMALGAHEVLGAAITRTLLITKDGHVDEEARQLPRLTLCESSHPLPDARSLAAGECLLEFVRELPASARPLFLISGGASSLVEALVPGADLSALRALNRAGLASGIDITELNARRARLSRLKGGRLAEQLLGRAGLALFISDVPGDDPAVIGSGLLGPPLGPAAAADRIEREVVASIDTAVEAARARAGPFAHAGRPVRFAGSALALGAAFARELIEGPPGVLVRGGESVVVLPPNPGRGGRNQHLALAAAQYIAGHADCFLLAAGTDGTDGPTADAGALVDGGSWARVMAHGSDPQALLAGAASASALEAAGDLLHTGPTGTNVGDLVLGTRLSKTQARAWLNASPSAADPMAS